MTKTRVLTALIVAPFVIGAVLLAPTPWLVAIAAVVFLAALWEWFRLVEVDDTLARSVLLLANLLMMAALVWASPTDSGGSLVLFKLASVLGVAWWLAAMLWLRHPGFAADHDTHARVFKLAAGTLSVVPAPVRAGADPRRRPGAQHAAVGAAGPPVVAGRAAGGLGRGQRRLFRRAQVRQAQAGAGHQSQQDRRGMVGAGRRRVGGGPPRRWPALRWPSCRWSLVALVTAVFSVFGDLFESLLKRHAGAKDRDAAARAWRRARPRRQHPRRAPGVRRRQDLAGLLMQRVAVLGATGSIGASALDVIARHPACAPALAAGGNVEALVALCVKHRPDDAVIADETLYPALRDGLSAAGLPTRAHAGTAALDAIAGAPDTDTVVAAVAGAAGLDSTSPPRVPASACCWPTRSRWCWPAN